VSGARRVLAGAALWRVAATTLLAAPIWGGFALAAMLALRFLLGVGEAPTFPSAAQAVARCVPPAGQGRANGFVIAAIGVGSAAAPPLVTAVMVGWGWLAGFRVPPASSC